MRKITMTESATLDFPPISDVQQSAPAPTALSIPPQPGSALTVIDTGVPEYLSTAQMLSQLEVRLKGIAYPALETGAGMQVAIDDRRALRDLRIGLNKLCESKNKEQRALTKRDCEARDAGAAALTAAIEALEKPIDEQIKAEEARKEAARLERQRIEAERVARHQAGISTIRSYITQAQGKTSEQIARVLPTIEAIDCGPDRFEEFSDEATKALGEVLLALRELHDTTKAREEEAARLEAQRLDQARVAFELAEAQRKLYEQAAELKRRQDEIDRAEREAQSKRKAEAEAARIASRPPEVPVSPVDDKTGSGSEAAESEPQADPTEALPIAAAKAMDLPEAIEQAPTEASATAATAPNCWQGGEGWESLAWELCTDENGEDACNELIWEGGAIPEPWGERWLKYEGEAKRLIALVRKLADNASDAHHRSWWLEAIEASARELAGQQSAEPVAWGLTRSIIHDCPAIKMPQSWIEQIGMVSQIVALKGADQTTAQRIVDALNAHPPAQLQQSAEPVAPTPEAAHEIGAKGGPIVEAERIAFEAWMRGHCWSLGATWNGEQYIGESEQHGGFEAAAMGTRRMWAAWRDRAALSHLPAQIQPPTDEELRALADGYDYADVEFARAVLRLVGNKPGVNHE